MEVNTFKRVLKVSTLQEAFSLCELIHKHIDRISHEDVAETFGCEVEYDIQGEVLPFDYSPMLGDWHVHFAYDWDRAGDFYVRYASKLPTEIPTVTKIAKEYTLASDYVDKHGRAVDSLQDLLSYECISEETKKEILHTVHKLDVTMFREMQRRLDIVTGDLNPYEDY